MMIKAYQSLDPPSLEETALVLPDHSACSIQAPLEATLVFSSVANETAQFDLELHNHLGAPAAVRHAIELVDDLGNPMIPPYQSADRQIDKQATARSVVELPARLADGYYIARATVVGVSAGNVTSSAQAVEYLESKGGTLAPISTLEYHKRSRADEGRRL